MADILYQTVDVVVLKVKIPRHLFDATVDAFGSQGRTLRAFREHLPLYTEFLVRDVLPAKGGTGPGRSPGPGAGAAPGSQVLSRKRCQS